MRIFTRYCLIFFLLFLSNFIFAQVDFSAGEKMQSLFIYNFASKYIQWTAAKGKDNFVIGIYGESILFEQLKIATAGKMAWGKNIEIKKFNSINKITDCYILFIPFDYSEKISAITSKLENTSTLIITETNGALQKGADINFVKIDRRIKFETNKASIDKKGITVSPDLLKLSVYNIESAPESNSPIKTISPANVPLPEISEKNYEKAIKEMEDLLTAEKQVVKQQKEDLGKSQILVDELGQLNQQKQELLNEKQTILSQKEREIEEQFILLRQLKEDIKSRETLLMEKQKQISIQDKILNKQFEDINKQKFIIYSTAAMFMLALFFVFFMVRTNRQKQKSFQIISAQKQEVEKSKKIIEEKNRDIVASIQYAQRIQQTILPPAKIVKQYLENSFILFKPRDIVSGDFYWMENVEDKILFAVVDCTGHGVPGAFVSIVGHNGLNRAVKEFGLTEPAKILDKLNDIIEDHFSKSETEIKDGMDIALVNLDLKGFDPAKGGTGLPTLQYAGAGNSLYHIANRNLTEYSADKQPIGKFPYRKPFTNNEIQLKKGDTIYIFTDGYADQFGGPKGKKFKYSRFEKLLFSLQEKSMTEQKEILNKTIDDWRGDLEQIDDICIIGMKV